MVVVPMTLLLLGGPKVLDAGERVALPFIFDTPTGAYASLPTSEAIDQLARLLLRHTDFSPREIPAKTIEGCKGSITCMGLRARAQMQNAKPSHLAVFSNLTAPGRPDRVSALLIDLEAALECSDTHVEEVDRERCASEHALVASDLGHRVASAAEMRRHFDGVVNDIFRPALEATGHWEPLGRIELTSERARTIVSLDGVPIGSLGRGRALITGVRAGRRTLRVEDPDGEEDELELSVDVAARDTAQVTIRAGAYHPVRTATLWSGLVLAAAGIAFTVWGLAGHQSDVYCAGTSCSDRATFKSVGGLIDGGDQAPRRDVLAVPLGYSLFVIGGAFTLGAIFEGEEADVPWISILAGSVAGGVAYAISAAVD